MANTILIKHGSGEPTVNNLKQYELGFSDDTKKLYINSGGEIIKYGCNNYEKTITLNPESNYPRIENLLLTSNCSVFIDLNYPEATEDQIKAFRQADLVYNWNNNTVLELKVNGKKPASNIDIPIQITVVY